MKHLQRLAWILCLSLFSMPLLAQSCNDSVLASTPSDRFRAHADGTVTDTRTRLTWMRCAQGMSWQGGGCGGVAAQYEWTEATQAVRRLNGNGGYAGHSDWRLPTREELASLVENRCIDPAINSEIFPATPPSGFWSATRDKDHERGAWLVYFLHGKGYVGNIQQEWKLRLVRDAR